MPELPEVEGLALFLRGKLVGQTVRRLTVVSFAALKTATIPADRLAGRTVTAVARHGKFLDVDADGVHLVFHLAKAGWLRWYDAVPAAPARPGKGPLAARFVLDHGSGFDLTEAGTRKSLAIYLAPVPDEVPGIARLGPDPLSAGFTRDDLATLLAAHRAQIKGVLRDQSNLAGIGNAYSDEILHAARLSPFAIAANLDGDAVTRLYESMRSTLAAAVEAAGGKPAAALKDAKRAGMRVHGRAGQPCPVCGDTVLQVIFADSSLQYCPTCQTGGRVLADRLLSRLLK
ncbi:Fpg/Nei family DNA glycosylase [Specibacter cremeus]|uniref:Fpg/Nei family DNA glycosylase n=1 Tax=Specibacter cremeus TaxID=1629051 RepID=UPI000F792D5E|nr:DNA-formamidopyrimidine glycosylase family protein [Specibacter cremeus]